MDSDAEKWEAVEDSSNVVRNSFSFSASLFVNEIPDILFRLPLLAFFPPLWVSLDQEYLRVSGGTA